jgi:LDH2 family malate/lactate/ureidoglycolate dehydrogenase
VKNSNHYGTAGYYVEQAIKRGIIGFSATNGMARMAPWGGRHPFFGTNPFAVGVPADKELPIIVDMATSLVARGKIVIAAQNNQDIPLGWARDKEGEDTTDAKAAIVGTVLPFAGAKGSAIALLIDVMTGILSGSVYGPHIRDMYADFQNPTGTSHIFGAINIDAFIPAAGFRATVDAMIREVKSSTPAKNVEEIFLPGEIEQRRRAQRMVEGVPLTEPVYEDLRKEGEACKVPFTL